MQPNILITLGVQNKEDVISNLLSFCIKSSESFRLIFIKTVCEKDPSLYKAFDSFTRTTISEAGIPDIVLVGKSEKFTHLFIIENKLKAEEGQDQTKSYSSEEFVKKLQIKLQQNLHQELQPPVIPTFIFLTLFPDQEPLQKDRFKSICYSKVNHVLKGFKYENDTAG